MIAFYGSIIFGFGFGMVATYRIGRIGWTQFAYWLGGAAATPSIGGTLAYWSTIFGPGLSKLWLVLGLPAFVVDIFLTRSGYEYSPKWLHDLGLEGTTEQVGVIVVGYIGAYLVGRTLGSPQRDFNKARLLY